MSDQNYSLPKHTISAAVIVINSGGEILLVENPRRGWEMPGGIVEAGESIKEAAIREVKEESGYDIKIVKFCGIYQYIGRSVINFFLGEIIGGEARTSEESLSVKFYSVGVAFSVIKNEAIRSWLEDSLDNDKHPFFIEQIIHK